MVKLWIIALSLFVFITFIYWKLTYNYGEKEYGKRMWKQWGTRTYYWHGALLISGAITVALLYLLRWANILTV